MFSLLTLNKQIPVGYLIISFSVLTRFDNILKFNYIIYFDGDKLNSNLALLQDTLAKVELKYFFNINNGKSGKITFKVFHSSAELKGNSFVMYLFKLNLY